MITKVDPVDVSTCGVVGVGRAICSVGVDVSVEISEVEDVVTSFARNS